VMENIERIDVSSLLLLEYLVDHLDSAKRLALCMTVKARSPIPMSTTMGRRASLIATPDTMTFESKRIAHVYMVIQKASRVKSRLCLTLTGLPENDSESLVNRVLGGKANPAVCDFLFRVTHGCPMHLTMLLQYCKEKRIISRRGGTDYDWVKSPEKELPKSTISTIDSVIRQRFEEGMNDMGKQVLRIASIIQSGEFDAIFLHEAVLAAMKRNIPENEILNTLRTARSLGFIIHVEDKTCPEREHAWSFKHDMIAEVIFNSVVKDVASKWAEAMEESYKALELRLKLGFFGRVDDFEKV